MTETFVKAFLYTLEHADPKATVVATSLIGEINLARQTGDIRAIKDFKIVASMSFDNLESMIHYWNIIGTIFCTNGFVPSRNEPTVKILVGSLSYETLRNLDLQSFLNVQNK